MINWLVNRLTPAKAKEPRWAELAAVLEQLWEEYFDPELSRLTRLRSSYTADDADLAKKIREMGDYFSFEMPKEADRPIALAWRRLEIEYKDMELILRSVFRRHFGDFPVEWFPLFAPLDLPYGTAFIPSRYMLEDSATKNVPPEGYFLTSRGVVGVDKMGLLRDGLTKETFRNEARPLVLRTKPLHIVFDGFLWYMRYDLGIFDPDIDATWDGWHRIPLQFGPLGARFDYTPADARHLDVDIFEMRRETERPIEFQFWDYGYRPWRLDLFLPDGLGDILPLDLLIPATQELHTFSPFNLLYGEEERTFALPVIPVSANVIRQDGTRSVNILPDIGLKRTAMQMRPYSLTFNDRGSWHLDSFLPDGFADVLPLDLTRHGVEVRDTGPVFLPYVEREYRPDVPFMAVPEVQRRQKTASRTITVPDLIMPTTGQTARQDAACLAFYEDEPMLDRLPRFDDISADFAPLDYPYGGFV